MHEIPQGIIPVIYCTTLVIVKLFRLALVGVCLYLERM